MSFRELLFASALLGGLACSSSSAVGPLDASPDVDVCADNFSDPRLGGACSPTDPCGPNLDCIYAPGCQDPHGTCERWGRCPDTQNQQVVCTCEGQTGTTDTVPISALGDACAPEAGPPDAGE